MAGMKLLWFWDQVHQPQNCGELLPPVQEYLKIFFKWVTDWGSICSPGDTEPVRCGKDRDEPADQALQSVHVPTLTCGHEVLGKDLRDKNAKSGKALGFPQKSWWKSQRPPCCYLRDQDNHLEDKDKKYNAGSRCSSWKHPANTLTLTGNALHWNERLV